MRNSDGTLTRKGLVIAGCAFTALTLAVLVALFITGTDSCVDHYRELGQETTEFLEKTCSKYDNSTRGSRSLELQDLADTGRLFDTFLPEDQTIDDTLIKKLIRSEHLSGAMVLDGQLNLVAQSALNEQNPYELWKDVVQRQSVRDIIAHTTKSYFNILDHDGTKYLFCASSFRGGLLVIYESLDKPMTDPYQMTTSSLLEGNTFHGNPTIFITMGSRLVSTNAATTMGDTSLLKSIKKPSIDWSSDSLTAVRHQGSEWLGCARRTRDGAST